MKYRLPPLNALRAFEAAARHMSFKQAADELHVTPAAVSHQIRTIEDYLGVALFVRHNRALSLTEHGKRCFADVSEGFAHLARAMNWVGGSAARDAQRLVVTAGPAFTAKWLIPRLARFTELHPHVQTRISSSLALCDFARDGIDVAIRFGQVPAPGLHVERLVEEVVAPLCSPRLLHASGGVLALSDLPRVPLIHDESLRLVDPATSATWPAWLKAAGVLEGQVDATRGVHFNQADHALQAAVEGGGVVLGRLVLAAPDLQAGRLVIPFGPVLASNLHFHFVCPLEKRQAPVVSLFRDWLFGEVQAAAALRPREGPSPSAKA